MASNKLYDKSNTFYNHCTCSWAEAKDIAINHTYTQLGELSYLAFLVASLEEAVSSQGVVAFLYPSLREVAYQVGAFLLLI